MRTVQVKDIVFGEGMPKVCVSIMPGNKAEIDKEIEKLNGYAMDVVEWRMDYYEEDLQEAAMLIHEKLKEKVLLATFRTKEEGGQRAISIDDYMDLNEWILKHQYCDMIDFEYFFCENELNRLIEMAHENHIVVILSKHDFEKTPAAEEMMLYMKMMQRKQGDISKVAVMPQDKDDVLSLLKVTWDMYKNFADRPLITMSMGHDGIVSRLCGEIFGSCMTFGSVGQASAPGQIDANDLKSILESIHKENSGY